MKLSERFSNAMDELKACLVESGFSELQALEIMKQIIQTIHAKNVVEGLKDDV